MSKKNNKKSCACFYFLQAHKYCGSALCWIILLLCTPQIRANESWKENYFKSFASPEIEILNENSAAIGTKPFDYFGLKSLLKKSMSWTPMGDKKITSEQCDFEAQLPKIASPLNFPNFASALRHTLTNCETQIAINKDTEVENILRGLSLNHNLDDSRFLQRVLVHFPGGSQVKGLLALKGDRKKRPFLIFRLGLFSSLNDFAGERFLLLQLFEQSAFNMLVLENLTGPDYIHQNTSLSFGGFDEGLQNFYLAKALRQPQQPLSQIISAIHMVGISLGGHGMFFSALFNEYNSKDPFNQPLVDSFLQFCPVVDLKTTMNHMMPADWKGALANIWTYFKLKEDSDKLAADSAFTKFDFLKDTIKTIIKKRTKPILDIQNIKMPQELANEKDFWRQNNPWPYYKNIHSPMLILGTEKDNIVPYDLNSKKLLDPDFIASEKVKNIQLVPMKRGYHCTLSSVYDWNTLTTIFNTFIASSDSAKSFIHLESQKQKISLDSYKELESLGRGAPVEVLWPAKMASENLEILVGSQMAKIPFEKLDYYLADKNLSTGDKELLERWVKHNIRFSTEKIQESYYLKLSWPRS